MVFHIPSMHNTFTIRFSLHEPSNVFRTSISTPNNFVDFALSSVTYVYGNYHKHVYYQLGNYLLTIGYFS